MIWQRSFVAFVLSWVKSFDALRVFVKSFHRLLLCFKSVFIFLVVLLLLKRILCNQLSLNSLKLTIQILKVPLLSIGTIISEFLSTLSVSFVVSSLKEKLTTTIMRIKRLISCAIIWSLSSLFVIKWNKSLLNCQARQRFCLVISVQQMYIAHSAMPHKFPAFLAIKPYPLIPQTSDHEFRMIQ